MNDEENENNAKADEENKSSISADLIRGHINTIILRSLYERDKYGYEIIEEIEKKSHGQYTLKQPTLYSALKRLENQGFINAYWLTDEVSLGGRRKYYTLTDSGREIAAKNQLEWEYSRTVIDNLISDKSFDFSQPAPTAVDFNILKKSTSRVRSAQDEDEDDEEETATSEEPKYDILSDLKDEEIKALKDELNAVKEELLIAKEQKEAQPEQKVSLSQIGISADTVSYSEQEVSFEPYTSPAAPAPTQEPEPVATQPAPVEDTPTLRVEEDQILRAAEPEESTIAGIQDYSEVHYKNLESSILRNSVKEEEYVKEPEEEIVPMTETQKRIVHENYLRLISERKPQKVENVSPSAEVIDTNKLIYNNRPETERDYRNLINNLFDKTLKTKPQPAPSPAPTPEQQMEETVNAAAPKATEEVAVKAENDGLKVNTSDFVISSSNKKVYNRGAALFKSSLIISIIMLLEFAICLIFRKNIGIALSYPFVIFAIAIAQLLVFGVLYYTYFEKTSRKSASGIILSASIIITVISVLIVFVVSLILNVNFGNFSDVCAKIIIPCLVILNIPTFAVLFHVFE